MLVIVCGKNHFPHSFWASRSADDSMHDIEAAASTDRLFTTMIATINPHLHSVLHKQMERCSTQSRKDKVLRTSNSIVVDMLTLLGTQAEQGV